MRVGLIFVAALVTFAASASAEKDPAESLAKTKFTITNPETNATLDAAYIQDGAEKFLVVHLTDDDDNDDKPASAEGSEVDDGPSYVDDSASDSHEERAFPVGMTAAAKVKENFPGKYSSTWNKVLYNFFRGLTPSNKRIG